MKEKAAKRLNGGRSVEKEDPRAEEEEVREGAAIQDPQGGLPLEETRSPPDLTYRLTYDPSPAPMTRNQWENSPTSLPEIEPKPKRSSIS